MEDMRSGLQNMLSRLEWHVLLTGMTSGTEMRLALKNVYEALKKEYAETGMISIESYNKWRGFLPQDMQRELRDLAVYPAITIPQHRLTDTPLPPSEDCLMINPHLAFNRTTLLVSHWRVKEWVHIELTEQQCKVFGYFCNARDVPKKWPTLATLAQAMAAGEKLNDAKLKTQTRSMWNAIDKINSRLAVFGIGDIVVSSFGNRWCIDQKLYWS